jgi:hypothetical protein
VRTERSLAIRALFPGIEDLLLESLHDTIIIQQLLKGVGFVVFFVRRASQFNSASVKVESVSEVTPIGQVFE